MISERVRNRLQMSIADNYADAAAVVLGEKTGVFKYPYAPVRLFGTGPAAAPDTRLKSVMAVGAGVTGRNLDLYFDYFLRSQVLSQNENDEDDALLEVNLNQNL